MLIETKNITKTYYSGMFSNKLTKAVDSVDIQIQEKGTLGLVGESGCGKSTLARLMANLIEPTEGFLYLEGEDISKKYKGNRKELYQKIQMIFQNPQQTFNPRMKLYDSMVEPLMLHKITKGKLHEKHTVMEIFERMGLTEDILSRYPHEISGGQAQRVSISRVLLLKPKLIIADEPTSMLDVSVQAQILTTLKQVLSEEKTALLFISHDLELVKAMCEDIAIMKDGKIIEKNTKDKIFQTPLEDYTRYMVGLANINVRDDSVVK